MGVFKKYHCIKQHDIKDCGVIKAAEQLGFTEKGVK